MAAKEEPVLADPETHVHGGFQGAVQSAGLPGRPLGKVNLADGLNVAEPTHPFGDALELVRAASEALERMRARCREVATYTSQQADYYLSELAVAHTGMLELQHQALAHEEGRRKREDQLRSETAQRRHLQEMLDETMDRSKHLHEQLRGAEKRALVAEDWIGRFQDEIAAAFGDIPRILDELDLDGRPPKPERCSP